MAPWKRPSSVNRRCRHATDRPRSSGSIAASARQIGLTGASAAGTVVGATAVSGTVGVAGRVVEEEVVVLEVVVLEEVLVVGSAADAIVAGAAVSGAVRVRAAYDGSATNSPPPMLPSTTAAPSTNANPRKAHTRDVGQCRPAVWWSGEAETIDCPSSIAARVRTEGESLLGAIGAIREHTDDVQVLDTFVQPSPDASSPDTHPNSPKGVMVYWRPGCPFCSSLFRQLEREGIDHQRVNIWDDPEAAAIVRSIANGNETVPTVVIGSAGMVNPSVGQITAVLASA